MARAGYSRAHYRRLANGGPDTPYATAERLYYNQVIRPTIDRERAERYPEINAENAGEMLEWQNARIAELLSGWVS